jgi:hypothetical protein
VERFSIDSAEVRLRLGLESDGLQLFNAAISYFEGGIRCGGPVPMPGQGILAARSPSNTCYVLAAELFLKCLASVGKLNSPRRHDLDRLFWDLPDGIRTDVAAAYQAVTGSGLATLRKDLSLLAHACTDWRYVLGRGRIDIDTAALVGFVQALYRTVRQHRPEWQVPDYVHTRLAGHRAPEAAPL